MAATQQKAKTKKTIYKSGASKFGVVITALSGILFLFLALTNQWGFSHDIELYFALFSVLIFIAVLLKRENRYILKERATPILFVLTAHTILFFVGMFYAVFPKFALQQFFLNIGGWFVFASAYMEFTRDEKNVRKLLSFLSVSIAVISFISVELASSRLLIGIFDFFGRLMSATVPSDYGGFETNTRVLSVMGNPNTFAPVAAIGMLLAIWLSGKSGSRQWRSGFYMGVAVLTGSVFVLSFSMGTILVLVPSVIGILFFSKKESRLSNALTIIYCLIFSAAGAAAVFTLIDAGVLASLVLLLISTVSGALYIFIRPIEFKAVKSIKSKIPVYAAAAVILAASAALALCLKGPYDLAAGESFRRAVYLGEGSYTIELNMAGQSSDGVPPSASVGISSMSLTQAALKEQTVLADGSIGDGGTIEFTVPEGSKAVFFRITANTDLKLSKAVIRNIAETPSDTVKELPLKYKLLPEFIVNRMQAIWVNDNAIQRFVFFRDGLRIGMKSPIIGHGGGAYEGMIFGAADYYYETVHTHNHYIQCFIDGGVIGFALFTAIAVLSFVCLFRSKKLKDEREMLAFIAGAVIMIFFHSLIEVDFSAPAFKALASVVLAVLALYCEKKYRLSKAAGFAASSTIWIFAIATLLLSFGRIRAVNGIRTNPTLKSIEDGVALDPFNRDDYMMSYLLSTMRNTDALVESKANSYVKRIESRPIAHDTAYLMAQYYLMKAKPNYQRGVELAEYYIREKKVNPTAWNGILSVYLKADSVVSPDGKKIIAESILRLSDYLDELNSYLPKEIRPSMLTEMLLWANLHMEDPDTIFLLDSRYPCDRDKDGRSDLIVSESGSELRWKLNLYAVNQNMYVLKVYQRPDGYAKVYVDAAELPGSYNDDLGCYLYLVVPRAESHSVEISVDPEGDPYFTVESVVAAG